MPPVRKQETVDKIAQAQALRDQGLSYAQIGMRIGVAGSVIFRWLNKRVEDKHRDEARHYSCSRSAHLKRVKGNNAPTTT